jgi:hypothetical protein
VPIGAVACGALLWHGQMQWALCKCRDIPARQWALLSSLTCFRNLRCRTATREPVSQNYLNRLCHQAFQLLIDELLIWIQLLQLPQELLRDIGFLQIFRKEKCGEQCRGLMKLVIPVFAHERLQDLQGQVGSSATGQAFRQ